MEVAGLGAEDPFATSLLFEFGVAGRALFEADWTTFVRNVTIIITLRCYDIQKKLEPLSNALVFADSFFAEEFELDPV